MQLFLYLMLMMKFRIWVCATIDYCFTYTLLKPCMIPFLCFFVLFTMKFQMAYRTDALNYKLTAPLPRTPLN
jgi:hypothetical protein